MRPLSIGLNLLFLVEDSGGSGTYARELVRGMLAVEPETRVTAFVAANAPRDLVEPSMGNRVEVVRYPVQASGWPPWHLLTQFGVLPFAAPRRRLDVIHGLANLVPPVSPLVPTVTTLLDVTWIHFPETMTRRATLGMKLLAPMCARAADRVIAISQAAKRDIVGTLGLDPAKIDVTPLGIRMEEHAHPTPEDGLRRRLSLREGPVVLCVAQKRPHKNLARLVRAVADSELPGLQLVIPGTPTPYENDLRALAVDLGVAERIHFPGWLPDAELEGLYRIAGCFVLPSLAEGFGLPVLEAMRRGVPVACANASSLPEVAGDAALLFPPTDVAAITVAIKRLLTDESLAQNLVRRGYERCRIFTWEETGRKTLAVYRRAIAAREERRVSGFRARVRSLRASAPRSPSR